MNKKRMIAVLIVLLFQVLGFFSHALTEVQVDWFKKMETDYIANNLGIDQDGAYGEQCVDLAANYATSIFPFTGSKKDYARTLGFGNANQLYAGARSEFFHKTPFEDGVIPKSGDLVIWGGRYGRAGHVASILYADANVMVLVHQNGSAYNTKVFVQVVPYHKLEAYNGDLIGFLTPKHDKIAERHSGMSSDRYYVVTKLGMPTTNFSDYKFVKSEQLDPKNETVPEIEEESKSNDEIDVQGVEDEPSKTVKADISEYDLLVDLDIYRPSSSNSKTDMLTRSQAIALITRMIGKENLVKEMDNSIKDGILSGVSDIAFVPNWAKSYLAYAIDNKIISGTAVNADGTIVFSPNDFVTGEQFATILARCLGYEVKSLKTIYDTYSKMVVGAHKNNINCVVSSYINRDEAAKIMFDVLIYGAFNKYRDGKIYLKDYLISEDIIDENILEEIFE